MGRRINKETRARIWLRDGGKCVYCLCDLPGRFQVDHKVPHCKGGSDDDSNLQTVCAPCNGKKGMMSHDEYLKTAANARNWRGILAAVRHIQNLSS